MNENENPKEPKVWYWRCGRCGMFIPEGEESGEHVPETPPEYGSRYWNPGSQVISIGGAPLKCGK